MSAGELFSSSILIGARAGQSYIFNDNSQLGSGVSISNVYYFYDDSINYGTVDSGNNSSGFYDYSYNYGTVINGTAFNGNSVNSGICTNDVTFDTYAINYGTVEGNATFIELVPDGSGNYVNKCINGIGIVLGSVVANVGGGPAVTALEYDGISLSIGMLFSNTPMQLYFYNGAYSDANINNCQFVNFSNATNGGTISNVPSIYFENGATNGGIIEEHPDGASVIFDNATNSGVIYTDVQFTQLFTESNGLLLTSTGLGTILGVATDGNGDIITKVKYTTDNSSTTNFVSIFYDTANNSIVNNDAYFYWGAVNNGYVDGNAYFHQGAVNEGTVTGIIYYKDAASARQAYIAAVGDAPQLVGGNGVELPFADVLGTGLQ
jgi:hypothetical protein